jgi:hypothetical protein
LVLKRGQLVAGLSLSPARDLLLRIIESCHDGASLRQEAYGSLKVRSVAVVCAAFRNYKLEPISLSQILVKLFKRIASSVSIVDGLRPSNGGRWQSELTWWIERPPVGSD